MKKNRLRVVTLNIHKGLSQFNRRLVIHELRDGLRALDPDLVFLQEVQGLNQRFALRFAGCPVDPQHEFLAGDDWQHVYGCNAVYDHGHHGNAILSRFGFVSFENKDVSDHRYERRGLLHSVVAVPGWRRNLHCVCVHLSLHERGRSRQLEAISGRLEELASRDLPIIVAGDFNDWRHRATAILERRLGMTEVSVAPRPRARDLPEPAADPAARPHLRARLQGGVGAGAPRQALVDALGPPRGERRARARLGRLQDLAPPQPAASRHAAVDAEIALEALGERAQRLRAAARAARLVDGRDLAAAAGLVAFEEYVLSLQCSPILRSFEHDIRPEALHADIGNIRAWRASPSSSPAPAASRRTSVPRAASSVDELHRRAEILGRRRHERRRRGAPGDALSPHVDARRLRRSSSRESFSCARPPKSSRSASFLERRLNRGEQRLLALGQRAAVFADESEAPVVLEPERAERGVLDGDGAAGLDRIDVQAPATRIR